MKRLLNFGLFRFTPTRGLAALLFAVMALPAVAQSTLVSFNGADGMAPAYGPLVQGRDGNYYGTTAGGGPNNGGTVFKVTSSGTLSTLYNFCSQPNCADGSDPVAGLVLGTDGNFYGTTYAGGDINACNYPYGCGTVFKITPTGNLTTLYTFVGGQGAGPLGGLVEGSNGNFYGTTGTVGGDGTLFEITPTGTLTTLHFFALPDGIWPTFGGLVLGTDGNFYGTTYGGGSSLGCNDGCGTVFKVTPTGTLTTLHSFSITDGANPVGGLVQAANGNFYGTTAAGGANQANGCGAGSDPGCGTIFEITPAGVFTTLYNFCSQLNCSDGFTPYGTLVQATDGNFYGTTYLGGEFADGTVFEITPGGALSTHSFDGVDGFDPFAGLLQATSGTLYGTTYYGGAGGCANGCGTVFTFSSGIGPFVQPVTYSGTVGTTIEFLGQGFTSKTTVSFNGTPAARSVKSGTYLTATVPRGATTGFVTITTSSGALHSNKIFTVIP